MMKQPERMIDRFRRRIFFFLILNLGIKSLSVWLFVWGSFYIAFRMGGWLSNPVLILSGFSGAGLVIVGCGIVSYYRLPKKSVVRALLDERGRCGGLLAAGEEYELGEWSEKVPETITVPIRWRAGKAGVVFLLSVLFCTAGGFVKPAAFLQNPQRKGIESQSKRISEEIELLKEAEVLTEDQAKDMEEKLAEIEESAEKEEKAESWEAMDHLEETLDKTVKESAESAVNATEKLTQIEAISEMLAEGEIKGEDLSKEAAEMLAAMAKEAMEKGNLPELSEAMKKALAGKKLTAKQLRKIAKLAKLSKADIERMMKKMCKGGMCSSEALSACKKAGMCDKEGLAAFLKGNCESGCLDYGLKLCCGSPGRGGVDRGRGDAEMTWSEGTSEDNTSFREEVLNSQQPDNMEESETIAMSKGTPEVEKKREAIKRGGFAGGSKSGGEAAGQIILPKHRAAVRNYFERGSK
jgi:hypothetical protein